MNIAQVSILGWLGWVGVVLGGCDGSIFIYRSFCLIFFVLRPHTKFQPSSSMRLENIPLSKVNRTDDIRHTTPPLPNYSPRGILDTKFYNRPKAYFTLKLKHLCTMEFVFGLKVSKSFHWTYIFHPLHD